MRNLYTIHTLFMLNLFHAAPTIAASCDTIMWAAGGSDGLWDINYPVLASGPSTPWCTMDEGATGEGVKSVQKSLNR